MTSQFQRVQNEVHLGSAIEELNFAVSKVFHQHDVELCHLASCLDCFFCIRVRNAEVTFSGSMIIQQVSEFDI